MQKGSTLVTFSCCTNTVRLSLNVRKSKDNLSESRQTKKKAKHLLFTVLRFFFPKPTGLSDLDLCSSAVGVSVCPSAWRSSLPQHHSSALFKSNLYSSHTLSSEKQCVWMGEREAAVKHLGVDNLTINDEIQVIFEIKILNFKNIYLR